ncbi:hypothetical protein F53441_5346 [Fusarium austroafricanum]|uniref:Uncharacterized protein n=1 Tax=Fusarium austroafricanum TaxID=2364996 RepID=A0A8H4P8A8_9HYPO|nr:hypothetical protein F53441_5346 [Fusarium austroafricanum]
MSAPKSVILLVSSEMPDVNGKQVTFNSDKNVVLTSSSTGDRPRFLFNENESVIVTEGGSGQEFLFVSGPSGRGPYQLEASSEIQPFGVGLQIFHNSWIKASLSGSGHSSLAIGDENINDGHWVAWRDPEGNGEWSVYWVTPRPYNMDDLPGAVPIVLTLRSIE